MENENEEIIEEIPSTLSHVDQDESTRFAATLNKTNEDHDRKGGDTMEMNMAPPRRRRQSLFSEQDNTSVMLQEGEETSQYSTGDPVEAVSRHYNKRISVSAELDVSIRDRIRNKFADVLTRAQNRERFSRRLTVLRQKSMVDSRSFENGDNEEHIEEQLHRSFQRHDSYMQRMPPTHKATIMAPPELGFDFFTKVYDPASIGSECLKKSSAAEGRSQLEEVEGQMPEVDIEETDDTKRLLKRLSEEDRTPAVLTRAFVTPFSEQVAKERQIYFTPSWFPMSRERQPGQNRRLEEEGFYAPEIVQLPPRSINTMEERLMKEPERGAGWFGDDGKLIGAAPTLANFPSRLDTAIEPKLQPVYSKAVMSRRGITEGLGTYQLDVDVSKLLFTHHPLFSTEQVLSMKLMQLYKNYLQRAQENPAEYFANKLRAVMDGLKSGAESPSDGQQQRSNLRKEAKELRRQRNKEEILDRKLLQNMLHTWNVMKQLRQKQGYVTTSLQLYLKKQDVEADEDRAIWEADLMEELEQEEWDYSEWCSKHIEEYHIAEQREREDTDATSEAQQPPQFPPFDREETWNRLMTVALKTRRNPGEPVFMPVLGSSAAITPTEKCPNSEKERRQEISRTRINMKIYFNDLEVCTTPTRSLNFDFCVPFSQVYNLHVYELPHSIRVKVFETTGSGVVGTGGWTEVGTVYIAVPNTSQITTANVNALEEIEFSNSTISQKTHSGVGSGVPVDFQTEGIKPQIFCTSGVLQCSALWGRAKNGAPLAPPGKMEDERFSPSAAMGPGNVAAMEELQQMLRSSKFDPNDPQNLRLYSKIKDVEAFTKGSSKELECFRLEPPECELVPEDIFLRNSRFRLLQLRHEQIPEFRSMRMVPASAHEIPVDIFTEYERRVGKEKEKLELSDIDAYRQAADKYVTSVRERVIQRLSTVQQTRSVQDMISEEPLPSLKALTLLFEERGRPLKPVRKERKRVTMQNLAGIQVKLLVNIVRAFNVPIRDEKTMAGIRTEPTKLESPMVEPFVEVCFQGQSARTSVLQGTSPTWNQQLLLNFAAPNDDYAPANLQRIVEPVVFNLYDRVIFPLPHDDREGDSTIHQQIEKRWLGSLEIPFCTIYYNGKVSGAFRLKVPPILLGYSLASTKPTQSTSILPHLQMFVAIDPPLMTPEPVRGRFESIENESFLRYADRWVHELHDLWPLRRYLPLIIDTHGRTVFVGRFLRSIPPPPEVEVVSADKRVAADLACRIVSLIPFVSDPVLFPGLCDIWSSCDQFFDMSCGDEEEHAVLLWCWLSALSLPCHLLLGNGIPEGPRSAYVLAQFPGGHVLYNAATGASYDIKDPLCPLRSVGCAVAIENLWANIQANEHPSAMSFDFSRAADWKPFFHTGFSKTDMPSVQPETLSYYETDSMNVLELQEKIERVIRERIMLWRPHLVTRWNRYAAQNLRQLLQIMETTSMVKEMEERHAQALQTFLDAYRISGFPLNSGYVSLDRIADAVSTTNVHANVDPTVEFAVAVYVHAYTNNILSVWVYVASLVKRR